MRAPTSADGVQSVATVPGLLPNTSYCFSLVAQRDGQDSPRSDEKCVGTLPAPPSASPTPGGSSAPASASATAAPPPSVPPPVGTDPPGQTPPPGNQSSSAPPSTSPPDDRFAGGKWIAVPFVVGENAAAEPAARDRKDKLAEASIDSFIFRYPQDFPAMTGPVRLQSSSVVLAVGPFDDQAAAAAACPDIVAATGDPSCLYFQPQP